jgi:hypothetical protein
MVARNLVSSWVFSDDQAWQLLEIVTPVVVPWLQLLGLGGVFLSLLSYLSSKTELRLNKQLKAEELTRRYRMKFLKRILPLAKEVFEELREKKCVGDQVIMLKKFSMLMMACESFKFEYWQRPLAMKIGQFYVDEWERLTEECKQYRCISLSMTMVDISRVIKEDENERNRKKVPVANN